MKDKINKDIHIEYSVQISNYENINNPIVAYYTESRSQPIVPDNADNYHCNIVRASFPMNAVPLHYFRIVEGAAQSNPDLGIWKIRFVNTALLLEDSKNVIFESNFHNPLTPPPPSKNQGFQKVSSYYFIYSYHDICSMLNTTIKSIFSGTVFNGLGISDVPYFTFEDGKFSLIYPGQLLADWQMFSNTPLVTQCLGAFSYKKFVVGGDEWFQYNSYPNVYYPKDQSLQIGEAGSKVYNYIRMTQEYVYSPQYLAFVDKILVSSSSLKARHIEIGTNQTSANNTAVSLPIIFSFKPDLGQVGVTRDLLNYYNNNWAENFILDLQGQEKVYGIDLKVDILDTLGNIWPFVISYGNNISISLVFSRKKYD